MKHPFIILGTSGAILMLGGAVWVYLFLFYEPAPQDVRVAENPFVEVNADEFGSVATQNGEASDAPLTTALSAGIALTERRVVGAVAFGDGYRVIEAGTGHAYEIERGGVEQKISNTTFPQAIAAVWAPSGERVAITREAEGTLRTFIVTLGAEGSDDTSVELLASAGNIAWSEDATTLSYTRGTDEGSVGVSLDTETMEETVLFTTPLRDITVLWKPAPLIVTKATRSYTGYAYRSNLSRVTDGMSALTAVQADGLILFSGISGNTLVSWYMKGTERVTIERGVIPEKCAVIAGGALCALPKQFDASQYPDSWYRGEEIYDDEVFFIDGESGVLESRGDLALPYRTPLDIVRVDAVPGGALMQSRDGHVVFVSLSR